MSQTTNKPLLPAYLIVGEDELKRKTALKRLCKRVSEQGDASFNSDEFDGERASGTDIVNSCNTLPFASAVRLVSVLRAEKLKKADSELIVSYLSAPLDTTVLAICAEKLPKNTRLYKACAAVGKTAIIDCSAKKRQEMPRFTKTMAKGYGVNLTDGGALALLDLVGNNTVLMDSELKKLSLSCAGMQAVTELEVRALVARASEVKPWEFVDAFSSRNASECVRLWQVMQTRNAYALLSMCVERIRELIAAQCLDARGEARTLAHVLGVQDWRVKNHLSWSRRYSPDELKQALIRSVGTEYSMKTGSDPERAFLDWALATLAGNEKDSRNGKS